LPARLIEERTMRINRKWIAAAIVLCVTPAAWPWHHEGHMLISRVAVAALPPEVPAFFRAGAATVAHCSVDPDLARNALAPQLGETEGPEHYLDLEALNGVNLPPTRAEYVDLLREMKLGQKEAGLLPYAITEWEQRLMIAFAEQRRWPDNAAIQSKCLVYAGILCHYAGDLNQPLHTTIHFNGRVTPANPHPKSGIHTKVDDLLCTVKPEEIAPAAGEPIEPLSQVFAATMKQIKATNALVDTVYKLEPELPKSGEKAELPAAVKELAIERGRASVKFAAALMLTAWRDSARVKLPEWLEREEK
jgi:hypothetical protein